MNDSRPSTLLDLLAGDPASTAIIVPEQDLRVTYAPLNPAYKEDDFRFYLEDTNAKVLLLPPDGADEARRAAGDKVPIIAVDLDEAGKVRLASSRPGAEAPGRTGARTSFDAPSVDDTALILHTSG